MIAVEVAI